LKETGGERVGKGMGDGKDNKVHQGPNSCSIWQGGSEKKESKRGGREKKPGRKKGKRTDEGTQLFS